MTSESAFSLCTGYGSVKADQVPRLLYIVAIRLLLAGYQHLHALDLDWDPLLLDTFLLDPDLLSLGLD